LAKGSIKGVKEIFNRVYIENKIIFMIGHTYRCENIIVVIFSLCIPKPHKHEEKANRLPMPTAVPIQSPSICISHLVVAGLELWTRSIISGFELTSWQLTFKPCRN